MQHDVGQRVVVEHTRQRGPHPVDERVVRVEADRGPAVGPWTAPGGPVQPRVTRRRVARPRRDDQRDPHHPLVDRVRAALPGVLDHDALPDVVLHADRVPLAGRSRKPDRAALSRAAAPFVPAEPTAVGRDTHGARA